MAQNLQWNTVILIGIDENTKKYSVNSLIKNQRAYLCILFIYVFLLPMQIILFETNTGSKLMYTLREFAVLL